MGCPPHLFWLGLTLAVVALSIFGGFIGLVLSLGWAVSTAEDKPENDDSIE